MTSEGDLIRSDATGSDQIGSDRVCEGCGSVLAVDARVDARHCSDTCRNRANRARRRVERVANRPVSAGLATLAAIASDVEGEPLSDSDDVAAVVNANLAAALGQPTTAAVRAFCEALELDYRSRLLERRLDHETAVADLRGKLTRMATERDELMLERDALAAEVTTLSDNLARLRRMDHLVAELSSVRRLILGDRRPGRLRVARPVVSRRVAS